MSKRDPRIEPKPGDVLIGTYRGKPDECQVDEVGTDVFGVEKLVYVGPSVCSPTISIKSWRRWAKTAEVIHRAD